MTNQSKAFHVRIVSDGAWGMPEEGLPAVGDVCRLGGPRFWRRVKLLEWVGPVIPSRPEEWIHVDDSGKRSTNFQHIYSAERTSEAVTGPWLARRWRAPRSWRRLPGTPWG